jgi:uncharacterized protein
MLNIIASNDVASLKTYVYRLTDPRTGETFYVGKGHGNRVFAHAAGQQEQLGDENLEDAKIKRVRDIMNAALCMRKP